MSLKDINVATIVQQTRVIAASADAQPDDVLAELVTNLRHCQREGFNACLHAGLHIAIMELVLAIPLKKVSFAESIIGTVLFCAERVDPRQNSLVADNIHYGLVRCIERYLNVSSVIIQSCLYIAMAMLHEGNCRDFVDSGIIDVVMTYLKSKFQGEEEQLILISGLLTELAHENDVVIDRLVASGYMEILVKIWSASEESSSATVSICRALVQLANNQEHRAQMLRLKVLNSCFNAFNIFQRDEEVIATVLRVIEKLTTQYTQACDNFVITGGLTSLSQIFHTAYVNTHPRLRRTLCSLIGNIVSQSRESSVADIKQRVCLSLCELIPTLIVGNATKDARVVNTVMEALTRCATDESIIRKFVAAKVIELASNSLRYNLRSDRCVVSTFLLLERLASYAVHYNPKEAEIPTQICSHGILPMIVSAIQCYPSNHQLVCACLSLLAHAALWPLRAVETLFLDNTIPLLLSMTWNALLENSLASNCMIQLLWAVSLNPTLREPLIEKHYVIVKKAITALMKVHPWKKDARLLAMGTRVMWVLALDPRVNTQLGNEGYVTQQIEVLKRSLDPTSTQSNRSDVIKAQQVVISNLYTMFTSVENQLKFVEGDGVSVLCEFLLKGVPITPHALSTIYNTLKVLLVHPTVPETLNNAEFIQTAVGHVEQAMDNTLTDVLASILSFFWGIVTCTKTCHERITDTVVQILITHTHSQEIIVESCLGVLWAMCYIYPSSSALSPISLLRTHKEKLVKGIVHETMTNLESERVCEVFSQLFQTVESIDETLIDIDVMFTFGLFNLIIQVANIHIRVLNIASSCIRLSFATLQRFPEVELYIQVVPKELCTTLLSLITEKFRQFHPYALTLQFTEHESHVVKTLLQTVVHQLTYSDI